LATSRAAVRPQPIRQAARSLPATSGAAGALLPVRGCQRNLIARLLGCLPHCLATGQHYKETPHSPPQPRRHALLRLDS